MLGVRMNISSLGALGIKKETLHLTRPLDSLLITLYN